MEEEVRIRRCEELEALQAYYGNDIAWSPTSSDNEDEGSGSDSSVPLSGPWFLRIRDASNIDDVVDEGNNVSNNNIGIGTPTLEIRLPTCYPLGEECPEPILHNVMMKPQLKQQLIDEMKDMYEAEIDVGIMWGERCREELISGEIMPLVDPAAAENIDTTTTLDNNSNDLDADCSSKEMRTFIPPTTRYHQPIRHFPIDVITNPKYERNIIHTPKFHPPKSGPSEIMIAHVCTVQCMEHVQWALAELLFNDKKVAKATHNMFAYRFHTTATTTANGNKSGSSSSSTLVSDNDDDGEKGSGNKLASLLDMSGVENVLVVVSRWYGGSLLGPARFKWIAGVARDGLVQGGYIGDS